MPGTSIYLTINTNIGNLPGQTAQRHLHAFHVSRIWPNVNSNLIPISTGGAVPFSPVPLTNRTAGIAGYSDHLRTPYIQSFNISIQHELARNLTRGRELHRQQGVEAAHESADQRHEHLFPTVSWMRST